MSDHSRLNDDVLIKTESEIHDGFGGDGLDHIPFKKRLKMLLASNLDSGRDVLERQSKRLKMSSPPTDVAIKVEQALYPSQVDANTPNLTEHQNLTNSTVKVKVEYSDSDMLGRGTNGTGDPGLASDELIGVKSGTCDEPTADDQAKDATISHHPELTTSIPKAKVEYYDSDGVRSGTKDPHHENVESSYDPPTDDLDHIPLNERKRILLTRHTLGTVEQLHMSCLLEYAMQGASAELSGDLMDGTNQHKVRKVEEESHSIDERHSLTRNKSLNIPESNASELFRSSEASTEIKSTGVQESERICSTQKTSEDLKSSVEQQVLTAIPENLHDYHSEKNKQPNFRGSSLSDFLVKMEVDTFESILESSHKDTVGTYLNGNSLAVKGETGVSYESYEDELDHMPLGQRIKLLISRKVSHLDNSKNLKRFRKTVPSVSEGIRVVPVNATHGRKRKKTATDSVEMALEEDAPGLLQVLIDKGILVDEIKLYGAMENEEALDSSLEESFGDLEAVVSKLFSDRSSLLKFAPLRCPKGSKDTYCLSCLISLVEQSRYLRFQNWPVEWGWCRDLQSFIFVFEKHNRIVLERPQYGYATYFFELVDSLPVHWQVKRLVIAMKLTSCSRATIIENKQLLVGEHLTEGEARVLEEYGWIPNSGLGSMLNYRDRVVHDKSNARDGAEWRSKIGKLLMDGCDGGTIVLTNLPKKFMEYKSIRNP